MLQFVYMNRKTTVMRISVETHKMLKKLAKGKTITQVLDEIIEEEYKKTAAEKLEEIIIKEYGQRYIT